MNDVKRRRANSVILQGSILAISAMIARILGFIYKIPLANMLTDTGNSYYGNASLVYALFLMISTNGFPVAVSKLMAEKFEQKRYKEGQELFRSAMYLSLVLGVISSVGLWVLAKPISVYFFRSELNVYPMRALAPALFIFSVLAVLRGYFQGMSNMMPTGISQIIEQAFNLAFSLILVYAFIGKGPEFGAMGGTLGTGIGAFSAMLLLVVVYRGARGTVIKKRLKKDTTPYIRKPITYYWKTILMVAIPVVIGSAVTSLTSVIDVSMFVNLLEKEGFTALQANAMNGIYTMKHQPLITLPVTLAAAFATASIPSLAGALVRNDHSEAQERMRSAIKITLLLTIPSAVGLYVLGKPITYMLYVNGDLETAGKVIQLGALSVVFFGVSTVSIGILQGIGKLRQQVYTSIIALFVKIIMNYVLIVFLNLHIYGVVLSNIIFAVTLCLLNFRAVYIHSPFRIHWYSMVVVPFVSASIMGVSCYLVYQVLMGVVGIRAVGVLFAIAVGVAVYLVMILKLKGLTEKEILDFPKGTTLLRLAKRLHLLAR